MRIEIDACVNGLPRCVEVLHEEIFGEAFPYSKYMKKSENHGVFVFLCYDEETPIGYAIVLDHSEAEDCFVWQCGIVPKYQGHSCMQEIMDEIVNFTIDSDYKTVSFATSNDRPYMLRFAVGYGFDIAYVEGRDVGEGGNKIYLKYFVHRPKEMTIVLDENGKCMSIANLERKLIEAYKANCIKLRLLTKNDEFSMETIKYVIAYCKKFARQMAVEFGFKD